MSLPKELGIPNDRIVEPIKKVIDVILLTIRTLESSGNYTAQNPNASASGAYQFIDSSWKSFSKGVAGASQYARAKDAPNDIQDAVARLYVTSILATCNNQLSAVPINWYYPKAWSNPGQYLDYAPPGNNGITIRQYATKWCNKFQELAVAVVTDQVVDATSNAQDVVDNATDIAMAIPDFLALLANPATWVKVAKVVGGIALIGIGISTFAGDSSIVKAVTGTVGKVPKGVASAAKTVTA